MPFVSDNYRFIYFAAPATGSSATLKALRSAGLGEMIPASPIIENGRRVYDPKHGDLKGAVDHKLLSDDQRKYFKVTGIRNPYSFHLNQYRRAERRLAQIDHPRLHFAELSEQEREEKRSQFAAIVNQSFGEYMYHKFKDRKPFELQRKFHVDIDMYLHQEWLTDDFERLRQRLELPENMELEEFGVTMAGKSGADAYKQFYDDELVAFVARLNKPFFERFPEYRFGI